VHRHQLRESGKWRAWLRGIVVQRCRLLRRVQRGRGREKPLGELLVADSGGAARATQSRDSAALEGTESLARMRRLIDELPTRQREVLILRHLEGLDTAGIAEVLGMAEATVRVQLKNARDALAEKLSRNRQSERST